MERKLNPRFVKTVVESHLTNIEKEIEESRKYLKRMHID